MQLMNAHLLLFAVCYRGGGESTETRGTFVRSLHEGMFTAIHTLTELAAWRAKTTNKHASFDNNHKIAEFVNGKSETFQS